VPAPLEIELNGHSNVIHTFLLKGKKIPSIYSCFDILCKKGFVLENDKELVEKTKDLFNELHKGKGYPAWIKDRNAKGYTL
jgi:hypothetical protein